MVKKTCCLSVLFLLSLSLGLFAGWTQPVGAEEKTFTFSRPENIVTWDPHDNHSICLWMLQKCIYDGLVFQDADGTIQPHLATQWSISPDSKEYTFTLRKGVKFHNGEDFTAESVKVSLGRLLPGQEPLKQTSFWNGLQDVQVIDDYTVKVIFSEPNGVCLNLLVNYPMIPPKAFNEMGKKLFEHPIGSGLFEFEEWKKGQKVVLTKNNNYWGPKANVDKLVYLPINEDSTRIAGVQTGDIDMADTIPPDQAMLLKDNQDLEVIKILAWDQIFIGMKMDQAPFTDKNFRDAINLAIDRKIIVDILLLGGRESITIIPQGVLGFNDSLEVPQRDVEKAKQLVANSSYKGEALRMIAPTGWYPKTKEVMQAIQANLMEIGLNVSLELQDGAAYMEKRGAGNYDLYYSGWAHAAGEPHWLLSSRILNDAAKSGHNMQKLNELILAASQTADFSKRKEFYMEMQQYMYDHMGPVIPVYQMEHICIAQKGVKNVIVRGDKVVDFRYVAVE